MKEIYTEESKTPPKASPLNSPKNKEDKQISSEKNTSPISKSINYCYFWMASMISSILELLPYSSQQNGEQALKYRHTPFVQSIFC